MVIVKVYGGLGNQMFQYAVARALTEEDTSVFIELNAFSVRSRKFERPDQCELDVFPDLKVIKLGELQGRILLGNNFISRTIGRLIKLNRIVQKENEFIFISPGSRNYYLNGYFQSEKYFSKIRHRLIREFRFPLLDPKNSEISTKISGIENSVSLHIRRGDYLDPIIASYHGVLSVDYYREAVRKIASEAKNAHFFIFSDDIGWCRTQLGFIKEPKFFVSGNEGKEAWKDMCLMSKCRHHIIANSSFSWWGAWLSVQSGLKFAPAKWFNAQRAVFSINDFIPEQWNVIDC